VGADEAGYISHPQPGYEALPDNVAYGKPCGCTQAEHLIEIAGEMTRGEDFSGDFEPAMTGFARSAEPSLHLGGSRDCQAQLVMLFLEPDEALLEGADTFEEFRGNVASQSLRAANGTRQLGQGEVCPSAIGAALHVFGLTHRFLSLGHSSKALRESTDEFVPDAAG
jgi:hypothetical protein